MQCNPKTEIQGVFSLVIFSTERKHKLQPTIGTVSWNSQSMYEYFNGLRCYILQFIYLPKLNPQGSSRCTYKRKNPKSLRQKMGIPRWAFEGGDPWPWRPEVALAGGNHPQHQQGKSPSKASTSNKLPWHGKYLKERLLIKSPICVARQNLLNPSLFLYQIIKFLSLYI